MARALTRREIRALGLGAAVIAVLFGSLVGFPRWAAWKADATAGAEALTLELERMRTLVASADVALDSAEIRVARLSRLGAAVLIARALPEAEAALGNIVREAARLSAVHLESIESRADSGALPPLRRVTVTVRATGDVTGLASLLQRLEGHPTLLAVRALSVRPHATDAPQDAVEAFGIGLTVEALALVSPDR